MREWKVTSFDRQVKFWFWFKEKVNRICILYTKRLVPWNGIFQEYTSESHKTKTATQTNKRVDIHDRNWQNTNTRLTGYRKQGFQHWEQLSKNHKEIYSTWKRMEGNDSVQRVTNTFLVVTSFNLDREVVMWLAARAISELSWLCKDCSETLGTSFNSRL